MAQSAPAAGDNSAPPSVTVMQEWLVIALFGSLAVGVELLSYFFDPAEYRNGKTNGFTIVGSLIGWLGHALWLTMDRRRRGLPIGWWRFGVIFLGPVAIWLYLAIEYRARALYLIPLSLAVYLVIALVYILVMTVAVHIA
jgi:hypothetical protein